VATESKFTVIVPLFVPRSLFEISVDRPEFWCYNSGTVNKTEQKMLNHLRVALILTGPVAVIFVGTAALSVLAIIHSVIELLF
jgi:hypothetical protein